MEFDSVLAGLLCLALLVPDLVRGTHHHGVGWLRARAGIELVSALFLFLLLRIVFAALGHVKHVSGSHARYWVSILLWVALLLVGWFAAAGLVAVF